MTTSLKRLESLAELLEPSREETARDLTAYLIKRFSEREISYATDARRLRETGASEIAWGYEEIAKAWREAGETVRNAARARGII